MVGCEKVPVLRIAGGWMLKSPCTEDRRWSDVQLFTGLKIFIVGAGLGGSSGRRSVCFVVSNSAGWRYRYLHWAAPARGIQVRQTGEHDDITTVSTGLSRYLRLDRL